MWLFLWVVFVLTAIGFFLWSYHATYEQKRAWKTYSKKNNLQYVGGRMLDTPSMTGEIKGRLVNFYPQIVENQQGQRQTQNVIEVFFNMPPDIICVIAKPGFMDFVTMLDLPESFMIEDDAWPKMAVARTLTDEAPEIWFGQNPTRVQAIQNLFKLPFDTAFFCDTNDGFLALRTSNPLGNAEKLNKLVMAMFKVIEMLEHQSAEAAPSTTANPNDDNDTVDPETDASKS